MDYRLTLSNGEIIFLDSCSHQEAIEDAKDIAEEKGAVILALEYVHYDPQDDEYYMDFALM